MKKRGNCGLKQARYETSWRELAWRWRAVQNSFTKAGISRVWPSGPPNAVASLRVGWPNSRKAASSAGRDWRRAVGGLGGKANGSSRVSSQSCLCFLLVKVGAKVVPIE